MTDSKTIASHGRIPDSICRSSSLHQKRGSSQILSRLRRRCTHGQGSLSRPEGRPNQCGESWPGAATGRPPGRPSKPVPQAIGRARTHPHCNEECGRRPWRSSRERERHAQTTDARGRGSRGLQSYGRYLAALYNTVRPHGRLGKLPPSLFAAATISASQRGEALRSLQGSAPRPVAPPSLTGSNEEQTLARDG
jgi:hypothetical protein